MPDSRLRTVEKRVVLRSVCAAATAEAKAPNVSLAMSAPCASASPPTASDRRSRSE